jgi:hypothetical protein
MTAPPPSAEPDLDEHEPGTCVDCYVGISYAPYSEPYEPERCPDCYAGFLEEQVRTLQEERDLLNRKDVWLAGEAKRTVDALRARVAELEMNIEDWRCADVVQGEFLAEARAALAGVTAALAHVEHTAREQRRVAGFPGELVAVSLESAVARIRFAMAALPPAEAPPTEKETSEP